jgi:lipopolysaccharide heptosyltransferase II
MPPHRILIVQTAFIGDVILASALIEKLNAFYPDSEIDFLLRKGNESLFENHPKLKEVHVWDKKGGKYKNLYNLIGKIRTRRYDILINVQRFANSGLLTALSKAKVKIGFNKNPYSWSFTKKIKHRIQEGIHEVERNNDLIKELTDSSINKPKLYPSPSDFEHISKYKSEKYICIAPASVWFTKQFPKEKWIELIKSVPSDYKIYLLGAPNDDFLCRSIIEGAKRKNTISLCGDLNLLQSAALMKTAEMNFVNDSAPMHLASAVNAKTTAIYCSTTPKFGFGPLADQSWIAEVNDLSCRPCGLHGLKSCPKGHFKCGFDIDISKLIKNLEDA